MLSMACISASVVSAAVASDSDAAATTPGAVVVVAAVEEELLLEQDEDSDEDNEEEAQLLDASELTGVVVASDELVELLAMGIDMASVMPESSSCLSQ